MLCFVGMNIIHVGLIYISSFKESLQQISKDQEGLYIEVNILLEILKEVEVNIYNTSILQLYLTA